MFCADVLSVPAYTEVRMSLINACEDVCKKDIETPHAKTQRMYGRLMGHDDALLNVQKDRMGIAGYAGFPRNTELQRTSYYARLM